MAALNGKGSGNVVATYGAVITFPGSRVARIYKVHNENKESYVAAHGPSECRSALNLITAKLKEQVKAGTEMLLSSVSRVTHSTRLK